MNILCRQIPVLALQVMMLLLLQASTAHGQESPAAEAGAAGICTSQRPLDRYRWLRQLSLDLRGRIPSIDEYEALHELEEVPEAMIAEMLASEDFLWTVRNYHERHMLPNLTMGELLPLQRLMRGSDTEVGEILRVPQMEQRFRGGRVPCLPQLQTEFDADGRPVPLYEGPVEGVACRDGACRQEGYVEVAPYWAPNTTVKVCAMDAMAQPEGARGSCDDANAVADAGCGCGPNLQQCARTDRLADTSDTTRRLYEGLLNEPFALIEAVVEADRPYFEVLTTDETYLNGPSTHYYRYMHPISPGLPARANDLDPRLGDLPEIDLDDEGYRLHARGEAHSGILTTLAYLLRFNSNRGRAHQFYKEWLCQPFVAPAGSLPPTTDPCSAEPDLSQRCGCLACHTTLEPAAAHWGRWEHTQRFGYMGAETFPEEVDECATCGTRAGNRCNSECQLYYVTSEQEDRGSRGMFSALEFLGEEEALAVSEGPARIVQTNLSSGRLQRCAAQRMAEHLLKRPLSSAEVSDVLPARVDGFMAAGETFRHLYRMMIASRGYRGE